MNVTTRQTQHSDAAEQSQVDFGQRAADASFIWLLCCLSVVLAAFYVVIARPGAAGDEPSHFENVVFYSQHWCLPVLGQPGVTYEGQMGPVYYYLSAMIFSVAGRLGEIPGFYVLRAAWLTLVPVTIWLSYYVARLACPGERGFALSVATFMALNPSLLAIASSVQNDMLSIVLSLAASILTYRLLQSEKHLEVKGIITGAIVGVAILTKATAVFFVPAVPIYSLLILRWKSVRFFIPFFAGVGLVSGWWFARNILLYGDLTAQAALTKYHYGNNPPPTDLTKWPNLRHWLWVIESYYWLPIQYYRDFFHAPLWLRGFVGGMTAWGLAGMSIVIGRLRKWNGRFTPSSGFACFLAAQYFFCMGIYTYSCLRITHFAPRVTFPTIIEYAMIVACAIWLTKMLRGSDKIFIALLASGLLVANIYVLWELKIMPIWPCDLFVNW